MDKIKITVDRKELNSAQEAQELLDKIAQEETEIRLCDCAEIMVIGIQEFQIHVIAEREGRTFSKGEVSDMVCAYALSVLDTLLANFVKGEERAESC